MASPSTGISVGLSGTFSINGVPVTVNSGDLGTLKSQGVVFNLTAPVPLGNIEELIDWFNANFGTDIPTLATIQGDIPIPALATAFGELTGGEMILTALQINSNAGYYRLAFTYQLQQPVDILGSFLQFDALGLSISRGGLPTTSP